MRLAVQIAQDQWFCLGRIIEKNDHPKLPPYSSWNQDEHESNPVAHYSFKEAVDYCDANPFFEANRTLEDFGVHYKKPKLQQGIYKGVVWSYSKSFNCYACEIAEDIPFRSLRQVKAYISDYVRTTEYV
jgi:hypothetical protein